MKKIFVLMGLALFGAAFSQGKPGVVSTVDIKRYSGTWYEIARLPNSFERKLKCITATYIPRKDGRISVLNSGHYISDPVKVNTASGVAWIPDKNAPGKLKVQFFWPFSGDYWIIELDKDYHYVLVGDPSFRYLWILCRENKMDDGTYRMLLNKAVENGFDIKPIIKVEHDCR